jgi:hypothetical protein
MASLPLSLLKLLQEVSFGCLLVEPKQKWVVTMILGAIVASFGWLWNWNLICEKGCDVHAAFHTVCVMSLILIGHILRFNNQQG